MARIEASDTFRDFVYTHSDVIISEVLKEQTLKRLYEVGFIQHPPGPCINL